LLLLIADRRSLGVATDEPGSYMNSVAKFRIEDYLTAFLWGFYGQSDLFGESALTLVITDKGVGFD